MFNAPPAPAVFASICYREKGSAVPSLVDNDIEFRQLTKLFSFLLLSTASYEMRKSVLGEIRFEPVNWLLGGCVDTN